MTSICIYYKIHQPYRLIKYNSADFDVVHSYTDHEACRVIINKLADECYLRANEILFNQIEKYRGRFSISFSMSGTALELFEKYRPDVIDSFRKLVATGKVEILAETYYHSLSSLHSVNEFRRQVRMHSGYINKLFGMQTSVFRNTELIHSNRIADIIADMGYKAILCEGNQRILKGRSPNHLYRSSGEGPVLFLRNTGLSDDIAFRFDDTNWNEHPLTTEKFALWLHQHAETEEVINLMFDYETFGLHKKAESGIFDFLESLPEAVLSDNNFDFSSPSAALDVYRPLDIYDVPSPISWDDRANASCIWSENMMQNNMLKKIYHIEKMVMADGDEMIINKWGRLQAADYFYYMSKESCLNAAYRQHNPFLTPQEAFQNYSNIITDFEILLIKRQIDQMRGASKQQTFIGNLF
jgi:alpha-amylase